MDALDAADDYVLRNPSAPDAKVVRELLQSLRQGTAFDVQQLYELNLGNFDLAMEVLNAWRLQRYYLGGALVAAAVVGH